MKQKDKLLQILRDKGIHTAEQAVEELMATGALSHYAVCKYVGRAMWLDRLARFPRRTPTEILKDVARECDLSSSTLRRSL